MQAGAQAYRPCQKAKDIPCCHGMHNVAYMVTLMCWVSVAMVLSSAPACANSVHGCYR